MESLSGATTEQQTEATIGSNQGFHLTRGVVSRFAQFAAMVLEQAVLPFALAGRLNWAEGGLWIGLQLFLVNVGKGLSTLLRPE